MKIGDKVRWKDKRSLAALAMGDVEMAVIEKHPILAWCWKVQGPDGYTDWVSYDWVTIVKIVG